MLQFKLNAMLNTPTQILKMTVLRSFPVVLERPFHLAATVESCPFTA